MYFVRKISVLSKNVEEFDTFFFPAPGVFGLPVFWYGPGVFAVLAFEVIFLFVSIIKNLWVFDGKP